MDALAYYQIYKSQCKGTIGGGGGQQQHHNQEVDQPRQLDDRSSFLSTETVNVVAESNRGFGRQLEDRPQQKQNLEFNLINKHNPPRRSTGSGYLAEAILATRDSCQFEESLDEEKEGEELFSHSGEKEAAGGNNNNGLNNINKYYDLQAAPNTNNNTAIINYDNNGWSSRNVNNVKKNQEQVVETSNVCETDICNRRRSAAPVQPGLYKEVYQKDILEEKENLIEDEFEALLAAAAAAAADQVNVSADLEVADPLLDQEEEERRADAIDGGGAKMMQGGKNKMTGGGIAQR